MNSHHKRALQVILAAAVLDVLFGLAFARAEHIPYWHGLYSALANAVTVGSDIPPRNNLGYLITAAECLLIVPLWAAAISLFTSGLTDIHVQNAEDRLKKHLEGEMEGHRKWLASRGAAGSDSGEPV